MHNINYFVYADNTDKGKIQKELDSHVRQVCWEEGAGGLYGQIRFINHLCDNENEAHKYINEHDKGYYDQLAVRFKRPKPDAVIPKSYAEAEKRYFDAVSDYDTYKQKNIFAGRKSKTVGCEKCGSSLSVEYMSRRMGACCPLCNNDLHSASWKETLETKRQKMTKLEKAYLIQKQVYIDRNTEIMWLVKIEYHT